MAMEVISIALSERSTVVKMGYLHWVLSQNATFRYTKPPTGARVA